MNDANTTCLTSPLAVAWRPMALALGLLVAPMAMAADAAIITGYQVNADDPPEIPLSEAELAGVAQAADIGLAMALHHLGIDPGTGEYAEITGAAEEFFAALRPQDRDIERESFVAMYQSCMMRMVTPTRSLAIRIPPGGSVVYMEGWDSREREGFAIELNSALGSAAQATGRGWNSGIDMTPTGNTDTLIGYPVEEYSFRSSGGLGGMGAAATSPQQLGPQSGGVAAMVSVNNSGSAWVSEAVPGIHIVRAFYDNFSAHIAASQGDNSMFGGMMKNMVGMLQHGMPLYTQTSTQSKVAGRTMSSGTSESRVTGAFVTVRDPAECEVETLPPGADVMRMTSGPSAGAPQGSAGAGAGGGGSAARGGGTAAPAAGTAQGAQLAQPCDCSCAAFQRLQQEGESRRDRQDASPEEQAKAMCMMQCMQQFMACAMQGNR